MEKRYWDLQFELSLNVRWLTLVFFCCVPILMKQHHVLIISFKFSIQTTRTEQKPNDYKYIFNWAVSTCLIFGPWVYPRGSYIITHVRWSVGPSVVRPSVTKVTEPHFWKKSWGVRKKWGKTPIFGAFLMFFVNISKTALRILTKFCVWTVLIDT